MATKTGMRFSEAFAIKLADFDFANAEKYLHIIQELENKDIDLVMRILSGS